MKSNHISMYIYMVALLAMFIHGHVLYVCGDLFNHVEFNKSVLMVKDERLSTWPPSTKVLLTTYIES